MNKEIWKEIEGFNDYCISTMGRVKSRRTKNSKILSINHATTYPTITLLNNNNKKCCKLIHRLVAEAFIPNQEDKPQVNHKDCDKTNNFIGNLEWVTRSENITHSYKNGMHKPNKAQKIAVSKAARGENNRNSKLSREDVINIKKMINKGCTNKNISNYYNVKPCAISKIRVGRTWSHIEIKDVKGE